MFGIFYIREIHGYDGSTPSVSNRVFGLNGWFPVVRINGEYISRESRIHKGTAVVYHFMRKQLYLWHFGQPQGQLMRSEEMSGWENNSLGPSSKGKVDKGCN